MDIVEFIEKGLNYRLVEYQKKLLYKVAKYPDKYTIRLEPLSRANMCRIMLIKEKEHEPIKSNHKRYTAEIIITDERKPENDKDSMRKFIRRKR